ncbi:biosynthetic-type acetolactate synthase large subunit [Clostridium felsineum]|uniref:Acetolactate synthase n=1 Tax=Clostridium felsineum TaxID=36839 RepID=A0A1S8L6B0_9CLOT|nr:biosynthetic-type acetolactate synthase large subunit [Clostridium felsineum]URZ08763.1 Acetolactate synthase isozyme 1 large subunit [Clostridium felsineum]URZ09391.1 Acetolactate synthase isozyme 1 large subunit [Clostridium felsineum]
MKLSGAEIIIKLLEKEGIEVIAGIPGGSSLPMYNALSKSSIKHILARHEQGAGFISQGIARTTGKAAVCFATSGPGVTNLLTAIADAKLDSVPIIAITGQVPYKSMGTDAFQEVDTYGLTVPITKHNFLVRSVEELTYIIPKAFEIAETGRPGPVVIDVPKDIQNQIIEIEISENIGNKDKAINIDIYEIEKIAHAVNKAKKPLFIIGGGVTNSDSGYLVRDISQKNDIPVAATLMGLGNYPSESSLFIGMLGMHGEVATNLIVNEADLVLAFGIRFDDRATGDIKKFCPNATIVHVDIDSAEIDKLKKSKYSIAGDVKEVLLKLKPFIKVNKREAWKKEIKDIKTKHLMPEVTLSDDINNPINLIKVLNGLLDDDTIITTDVGQHQMWVAQHYNFRRPRKFITSGGLGTMGFGLPAAIGAAVANQDKKVVCISGDGSFMMNLQELSTLQELNLNVTVIILNNGCLGLVRQQQELFYEGRYIACKFKSKQDFSLIAAGFGIKSYCLKNEKDPICTLKKALLNKEPCVIDVLINENENVLPMVPPGGGNCEMVGGK